MIFGTENKDDREGGREREGAKNTDSISLVIFVSVRTSDEGGIRENSVETKRQEIPQL